MVPELHLDLAETPTQMQLYRPGYRRGANRQGASRRSRRFNFGCGAHLVVSG